MVGGSVPVFDEVVLSTALMNNIINIDLDSSTVVAQVQIVLVTLKCTVNCDVKAEEYLLILR